MSDTTALMLKKPWRTLASGSGLIRPAFGVDRREGGSSLVSVWPWLSTATAVAAGCRRLLRDEMAGERERGSEREGVRVLSCRVVGCRGVDLRVQSYCELTSRTLLSGESET